MAPLASNVARFARELARISRIMFVALRSAIAIEDMKNTILITGSSSGIGKATAVLFHEMGWNVIATMRQPEAGKELAELQNVLVTRLDVQDSESIHSAIQSGIARFGKIDVLLNNAGYGAYGVLEATPMEKVVRQFEVNVFGMIETTKAILPHFRANRSGTIINVSSMGGKVTFPLGTLYHGSKFAVEGLSESLHYELKPLGIRVRLIEPGAVLTDFGGRSFDFSNDESLTEYQDVVTKFIAAAGSMASSGSDPSLVARIILEAANDKSDQLRFTAGDDAAQIIEMRKGFSDQDFLATIAGQMGL